ncbi:hypothetical protein VPHF86_0071 [Vibrio phage F86]
MVTGSGSAFFAIAAFLLLLDKMYIMSLFACIIAIMLICIYVKISEDY